MKFYTPDHVYWSSVSVRKGFAVKF